LSSKKVVPWHSSHLSSITFIAEDCGVDNM
jgi:hypothetical protein